MGLFTGRSLPGGGYEPSTLHRWLSPKVSGNTINGLGETEKRRPRWVYHRLDVRHPWWWVQNSFYARTSFVWSVFKRVTEINKLNDAPMAPIAPRRAEGTAAEWKARVVARAKELGYQQVGVTRVAPELLFEGQEVRHKYIVVLARAMNYERLAAAAKRVFVESHHEILDTYFFGNANAKSLANWLRERGYDSEGFGSMESSAVNLIPAAIRAGIGELGKHGSMISRELGSSFRLSYVLTDVPLEEDDAVDIGAQDFCASCQLCTKECPPLAISDEPRLVRGELRWYVDFDRCVPYFNDNQSCALCLAVCPWSRPGVSQRLSEKMLLRRASKVPA